MSKAKIYIGTSGWMYKDWGKEFYPEDLKKGHLTFLAKEFSTVEVNSSFYHLPKAKTFSKWKNETPEDFCFAVKLSRFITHRKHLKGVRGSLELFLSRAKYMEEKLGVVLIQLPPSLKFDKSIISKFVEDLHVVSNRTLSTRFALEPRHASWMTEENKEFLLPLLKKENIALVFPHSAKIPSFTPTKENITADFIYVRFHGPSEFASSRYGAAKLRPWADRIKNWNKEGHLVFVYFNNDVHGHAVHDARTLVRQVTKTK